MYDNENICIDFGDSFNPQDVRITHNGENVSGVTEIQIMVTPDDIIKTKLTLCNVHLRNLKSEVEIFLIDPKDGKLKEVESIKFKNSL